MMYLLFFNNYCLIVSEILDNFRLFFINPRTITKNIKHVVSIFEKFRVVTL